MPSFYKRTLQTCLLSLFLATSFVTTAQTLISASVEPGDTTQLLQLHTVKGDRYVGYLELLHNNTVIFTLDGLDATLTFELNEISYIGLPTETPNGTVAKVQRNNAQQNKAIATPANQLLYTATALPFEERGSYRNVMGLWNQVDFQVTPNLSVGGALFIPGAAALRLNLHVSLSEYVHLGLNSQFFSVLAYPESYLHSYAVLTLGERKQYLNIGYGYWFDISYGGQPSPWTFVGASYQFNEKWRFYAEAGIINDGYDRFVLPTFMLSAKTRRLVWEFGLLSIPDSYVPIIPMLGMQVPF